MAVCYSVFFVVWGRILTFRMPYIPPQRLALEELQLLLEETEERHVVLIAAVIAVRRRRLRRAQERVRRPRRFWVRPWCSVPRRLQFGQYNTLFQELDRESEGDYRSYIRLSRNLFAQVLQRVVPRITKSDL